MTDQQPPSDEPIDGEPLGADEPGPNEKPNGGRRGKSGGSARSTGKGFGRQQTDAERKQEEEAAKAIRNAVVVGGLDWRHPGWEPTEQDRNMVRMLKFCGNTDEDVAAILDMSVETLQKHFSFELQYAKTMVIADLATRAVVRARQGNDVLTMFLLKTRGGSQFSEKAGTVAALNEALDGKGEIDAKRREDILTRVLDVLAPKVEKTKTSKTEKPKGEAS